MFLMVLLLSARPVLLPVAGKQPNALAFNLAATPSQQQAGASGNGDGPKMPLTPPTRVKVSSGVMWGQLLHKVMPVYPPIAKQEHISGGTVLHVIIGKDGKVLSVEPVSGPEVLRQEWIKAVKQWEYRPYLFNGQPTEVDTTVTMNIDFGG